MADDTKLNSQLDSYVPPTSDTSSSTEDSQPQTVEPVLPPSQDTSSEAPTTDSPSTDIPVTDASADPAPTVDADGQAMQVDQANNRSQPAPIANQAPGHVNVLDPDLLDAVRHQESSDGKKLIGPMTKYGTAKGPYQFLDSTWKEWAKPGQDVFNEDDAREVAGRYLTHLQKEFHGDAKLALAAYNAGPRNIENYYKDSKTKTWDEITGMMANNGAFDETQKYVKNIMSRYEKKKDPDSAGYVGNQPTQGSSSGQKQSGNVKEFSQSAINIMNKPYFDGLTVPEKVAELGNLYKSKQWDKETYGTLKQLTSNYWDAAHPDEQIDYSQLVGSAPILSKDQNPDDATDKNVLQQWKSQAIQKVYKSGVSPALLGTQFDDYLDNSIKSETDAYHTRNKKPAQYALDYTGNVVRQGLKGAVGVITNTEAGALRLAGQDQLADTAQAAPERWLGTPANDFMYQTDKNGYPIQNDDGTFKTHWQAQAAETVGNFAAFIGGGELLKGAEFATAAIRGLEIGGNSLSMANSTFKDVMDKTGDKAKAYTATLLALPAMAVASVGDLGIISGKLRPSLQGMSLYDRARYLGKAIGVGAFVGGVSNTAADALQQGAEISQTGQSFSGAQLRTAAITGAAGAAAGELVSLPGETKDFAKREIQRQSQVNAANDSLDKFRGSIEQQTILNANPKDLAPDVLANYGMEITGSGPSGVTVSKKSDIVAPTITDQASFDDVSKVVLNTPTPKDLQAIGTRKTELEAKKVKTPEDLQEIDELNTALVNSTTDNYQNNIKVQEKSISDYLQNDSLDLPPLPVKWNAGENVWEHIETGDKGTFLKDVLNPGKYNKVYAQDFSNIHENLSIIDGDKLSNSEAPKTPAIDRIGEINKQIQSENANTLELKSKSKTYTSKVEYDKNRKAISESIARSQQLRSEKLKLQDQAKNEKDTAKQLQDIQSTLDQLTRKNAYGGTTVDGKTIGIAKGLPPETKQQLIAHEVGHAAINQGLELSPEADTAIKAKIQEFKDRKGTEPASDTAKEYLLPKVGTAVKVDDNFSKWDPKEFKANQVAAVMLKRSGVDIGDYPILPEIESALDNVNLPHIASDANVERPTKQENSSVDQKLDENSTIQTTNNSQPSNIQSSKADLKTGRQKETALSKTITEHVPEAQKRLYDEISRANLQEEASRIIKEKGGLDNATEFLQNELSYGFAPETRRVMAETLLLERQKEFSADPSNKNLEKVHEAETIEAATRTSAGQVMGILSKVRSAENFPNFISKIKETFRKAGQDTPEFTDFQLKELKAAYEKARQYPEGTLQSEYLLKAFNAAVTEGKIKLSWPQFIKGYMHANALSGIGTEFKSITGHAFMGPIVTAIAGPKFGPAASWKVMLDALPVASAAFKSTWQGAHGTEGIFKAWKGKNGDKLVNALMDPRGLDITDNSTVASRVASLYNRFIAKPVFNVLQSTAAFNRALSAEGYGVNEAYKELQKQYGDDPSKLAAEAGKLFLGKDNIKDAVTRAKLEAQKLGLPLTDADAHVRAYELLRKDSFSDDVKANTADWADAVSLRGEMANPIQRALHTALYSPNLWSNPVFASIKNVMLPFGRAMLAISDYTTDFVPGAPLLGDLVNKAGGYERTPALKARMKAGQIIGSAIGTAAFGLAMSGAIQITGEEEQVLDKSPGDGKDSVGKSAKTSAQFEEFKQKGVPAYSIIFPGGLAISYKDIPGLNAVIFGAAKAKEHMDKGGNIPGAAFQFVSQALTQAIPFLGGSSLNSPYKALATSVFDEDFSMEGFQDALKKAALNTRTLVIPASSFLADVNRIYNETPTKTNQDFVQAFFKDVPVLNDMIGSKPQINDFGELVKLSIEQRLPGVGRFVKSAGEDPIDPVVAAQQAKGIIVPSTGNKVHIPESSFPNKTFGQQYQATREERLGKAFTKTLTNDEWDQFRLATGPHIKAVVAQLSSSSMPTNQAQAQLIKRVDAIRDQAMKRYIRTGQF